MKNRLPNYIRAQRKRAGLNERELADILGYDNGGAVSRHELFRSIPPLLMALAYEVVFQVPVSELFAGLREVVEDGVEQRIAEFKTSLLKQVSSQNPPTPAMVRKLAWIEERHADSRRRH
jgi:transcriptional regulator with XRE-family HTH domain